MKRENLLDCHGERFRAKIQGKNCEGVITIENDEAYLCQDIIDGLICKDKQGYPYSWYIGTGSENNLRGASITDFELLDNPEEKKPVVKTEILYTQK